MLKSGSLDLKTKELVATALIARCTYCIGIYTQKAFAAGATEAELWAVASVVVMMGGGAALTHVTDLQKAIEEFHPR